MNGATPSKSSEQLRDAKAPDRPASCLIFESLTIHYHLSSPSMSSDPLRPLRPSANPSRRRDKRLSVC